MITDPHAYFAGAVPEVYFIPAVFAEGLDCGVSNDDNVVDIFNFHGRDEFSADSHELSLKGCDVYGVDL